LALLVRCFVFSHSFSLYNVYDEGIPADYRKQSQAFTRTHRSGLLHRVAEEKWISGSLH
jgi:hypothetical protein